MINKNRIEASDDGAGRINRTAAGARRERIANVISDNHNCQ